jgi:multiple sugar transport system substrate-binding protein
MFTPGEKVIQGKFKWNVGLQPKGPAGKRGTALTINGMAVAAISKHKPEAWQFVKWLMEVENQVPIILAGGSRPALRTSVLNDQRLMTQLKAHKVFAKALLAAEPWQMPANYRWPEFNSTVSQVFGGVWAGTQTLEQAMPDAKNKLQAVIDKPAID